MSRTEKDALGEKSIPENSLYGIHALRARENFPGNTPFPIEWYKAVGVTKLACYNTYRKFINAAKEKFGADIPVKIIDNVILDALSESAREVWKGDHFDNFIVPALQGGAGTSINMNINEIITNLALYKSGHKYGEYNFIDPVEHANVYQSTNDVIPTALSIATMLLLQNLEGKINDLRLKVEELERENRETLRPGYTQMQEAVPSSFGILFSSYNEALSRDWWRISKCFERIKQVNIGGGAIGTGITFPRYFIMEIVPELRSLTGLQIAHSENLADATSNLDKWVEIHATLKSHAVNLEKISADLRLLASDISGYKTISLPAKQIGSSVMPGKINPVIPEYVISAAHKIYSNDMVISSLSGQGTLELNAYLPTIGYTMIESLNLLISCNVTMLNNLFSGLVVNKPSASHALFNSPVITTSLIPHIGYNKATEAALFMKENNADIFEANKILKLLDDKKLKKILQPGNLLMLGFSMDDLC